MKTIEEIKPTELLEYLKGQDVKQLKIFCKERKLSTQGKKIDLVDRLHKTIMRDTEKSNPDEREQLPKFNKSTEEHCEKCGESDVDLEIMPCCNKFICWDNCLYEMPDTCPFCGESIRVELKDPVTKEAYVEVITPTVELTKKAKEFLKLIQKEFPEDKVPSDSEIIEHALDVYLTTL